MIKNKGPYFWKMDMLSEYGHNLIELPMTYCTFISRPYLTMKDETKLYNKKQVAKYVEKKIRGGKTCGERLTKLEKDIRELREIVYALRNLTGNG